MNQYLFLFSTCLGVITVTICAGFIYINSIHSSFFLLYIILWFASFVIMVYIQFMQDQNSDKPITKKITNCPDGWFQYIDSNNSSLCINNQYGSILNNPSSLFTPSNPSNLNCSIVSIDTINDGDSKGLLTNWAQNDCKISLTNIHQNVDPAPSAGPQL